MIGIGSVIVQGGLVRPVVARIGDRRALFTGLVFGTLGFACWGLAPTGILFLAAIPLGSLMGFYGPAAQGLMTHRVERVRAGTAPGREQQRAWASPVSSVRVCSPGRSRGSSAPTVPGSCRARRSCLAPLLLVTALVIAVRVTRER